MLVLIDAQFAVGQDARLETVRAGYNESISRLQSIHATFELTFEPAEGQKDLLAGEHRLDWAYDGRRMLYHREPVDQSAKAGWKYFGNDGQNVWGMEWEQGGITAVRKYPAARANNDSFRGERGPAHFLGLFLGYGFGDSISNTDSLSGLLARPNARYVGEEDVNIDGEPHRCWRVDVGPWNETLGRKGEELPRRLWLRIQFDPQAGFLPRQIVFDVRDPESDDPFPNWRVARTVKRFRPVSSVDGWFPADFVDEFANSREIFHLLTLKVGEELPDDVFQPDHPEFDFTDP